MANGREPTFGDPAWLAAVILDDNRTASREYLAQPPCPGRKDQSVDMHEIDRSTDPCDSEMRRRREQVRDAAARQDRAPGEPLDDGDERARAGERIAPSRERSIAREQ